MESLNRKAVNMWELLTCITNAGDLICPELSNHHQQVAYLSYVIGESLNFSREQQKELMMAGLLHDIGALTYNERMVLIEDEPLNSQDHAIRGARLLEVFQPLKNEANIIRYHHLPWDSGRGSSFEGQPVPLQSHILHLADRVCISIDHTANVLDQVGSIEDKIAKQSGIVFEPELVEKFLSLSNQENIWLDIVNNYLVSINSSKMLFDTMDLEENEILDLLKIFSNIIDFRSEFTANHTAGVAKTAEKLAQLAGFSHEECKMVLMAGYLHDLGKLALSNDILEKPDKLEKEEFNKIKSHTYFTYRLLQPIKAFDTINNWASFHHEKLNGQGYPFHITDKNIPLGARIIAIADIFTAITEDRPYRKGMADDEVIEVLNSMAAEGCICPFVLSILIENYSMVKEVRIQAQHEASIAYEHFSDIGSMHN